MKKPSAKRMEELAPLGVAGFGGSLVGTGWVVVLYLLGSAGFPALAGGGRFAYITFVVFAGGIMAGIAAACLICGGLKTTRVPVIPGILALYLAYLIPVLAISPVLAAAELSSLLRLVVLAAPVCWATALLYD